MSVRREREFGSVKLQKMHMKEAKITRVAPRAFLRAGDLREHGLNITHTDVRLSNEAQAGETPRTHTHLSRLSPLSEGSLQCMSPPNAEPIYKPLRKSKTNLCFSLRVLLHINRRALLGREICYINAVSLSLDVDRVVFCNLDSVFLDVADLFNIIVRITPQMSTYVSSSILILS